MIRRANVSGISASCLEISHLRDDDDEEFKNANFSKDLFHLPKLCNDYQTLLKENQGSFGRDEGYTTSDTASTIVPPIFPIKDELIDSKFCSNIRTKRIIPHESYAQKSKIRKASSLINL